MSTNLYWRPVVPTKATTLPADLKRPLARMLYDHDGSLYGEPLKLDGSYKPMLRAFLAAGVDGAEALLNALDQHDMVEVWINE